MSRFNAGLSAKKAITVVVLFALMVGIWQGYRSLTRPTSIAQIVAQPDQYETRVVYVRARDVRSGAPLLGYSVCYATDDCQNWVMLMAHDPNIAGKTWPMIVHRPRAFGRDFLVLEQVNSPMSNAWYTLLHKLGLVSKPSPSPDVPQKGLEPFSGTVVQENDFFALKTFTVQGDNQQAQTYLSGTGGLPSGAKVTVYVDSMPALKLLNGQSLQISKQASVSLASLGAMSQAFDDRTVTVEGQIGRGLSFLGASAFAVRDQQGAELVVLYGSDYPAEGTPVAITGRIKNLAGVGQYSWMVLCASEVKLTEGTPLAPAVSPQAPVCPAPQPVPPSRTPPMAPDNAPPAACPPQGAAAPTATAGPPSP